MSFVKVVSQKAFYSQTDIRYCQFQQKFQKCCSQIFMIPNRSIIDTFVWKELWMLINEMSLSSFADIGLLKSIYFENIGLLISGWISIWVDWGEWMKRTVLYFYGNTKYLSKLLYVINFHRWLDWLYLWFQANSWFLKIMIRYCKLGF